MPCIRKKRHININAARTQIAQIAKGTRKHTMPIYVPTKIHHAISATSVCMVVRVSGVSLVRSLLLMLEIKIKIKKHTQHKNKKHKYINYPPFGGEKKGVRFRVYRLTVHTTYIYVLIVVVQLGLQ